MAGPNNVKIVMFPRRIEAMLNLPSGDVGRWLHKVGMRITFAAKAQVGSRSNRLRLSINMKRERRGRYQQIRIGSDLKYAASHHEGAKKHMIFPNNHHVLKWNSGSRIVYARAVLHPGTRPNKYLSDNLHLIHSR